METDSMTLAWKFRNREDSNLSFPLHVEVIIYNYHINNAIEMQET